VVIDLSACNVCFRVPVVISQSLVSEPKDGCRIHSDLGFYNIRPSFQDDIFESNQESDMISVVIDLSACNVCFRVPVVISQSLVSEPLPPDANTR
jgi:hypothetical protein